MHHLILQGRCMMPKQLSRLLVVFAVLITAMLVSRRVLLPKTFGERGHYRAAAVTAIEALPIHYAGREACVTCHSDVADKHSSGHHQTLSCEVCHGPAAAHADSPGDVKPTIPRQRNFCTTCHGYDPSRPTGFPQIDPVSHNPAKACIGCHNPHQPEPPHIPEDCGACHGQIARTKAVSRHAQLACTQCHNTPVQHKVTPQTVHPEKPRTREFCGNCHSKTAKSAAEIPRVEMDTHGGRYPCWQCHYPHLPEG